MRRASPFLVGILVLTAASGCASVPPAQMGQAAGTIAGAAILPGVGAPLGALAGTLLGMIIQKRVDQVTETKERQELGGQLRTDRAAAPASPQEPAPARSAGAPTRVWVDEHVQNGRLMPGHFEVASLDTPATTHTD